MTTITLNDREHATILAALKCYEQAMTMTGSPPAEFMDIATDAGRLEPMSDESVNELAERLNLPENPAPNPLYDAAKRIVGLHESDYLRGYGDGGRVAHAFKELNAALNRSV